MPFSASPEFSHRTRRQTWEFLEKTPNTVRNAVIIGGGIVGAGVLRQLALNGVTDCYLFEKKDFGSGTSGASSKLIHAGIRYLEQSWVHIKNGRWAEAWRNFIFVMQASAERKTLGRMAPHLIRPKPIYLVLGEGDKRHPLSVVAGVFLYYVMQIAQGQFFSLPRFYLFKESIQKAFPYLDSNKIRTVFSFWDSETDDARLVIENLQDAHRHGGHPLNYVEMVGCQRIKEGFRVDLKDAESGRQISIKSRIIINATGAFIDEVRAREVGAPPHESTVDRVAGCHINVAPPLSDKSFYITAKDNRLVFVLRRNDDGFVYSRIGTTERALAPEELSDAPLATAGEVAYLKKLAQEFFPTARIDGSTIMSVDAGIRPLRAQKLDDPFHKSREHDIIDDDGFYHVVGVKLTDFRRVSQELVKRLPFEGKEKSAKVPFPFTRKMYEDNSLESFRQTMVVHWEDYVFRRRGLQPLWEKKHNPAAYLQDFQQAAVYFGWGEEAQKRELGQVSDSPAFSFDS